ncbi:hypothetical protein ITP53_17590 [Nonomuraea sp. K274]|uniref:Tetratricopeptide repeat protein n=1 Tax=Nonomuraea cypriaca TaxID=1187855 RepID=A0A931ACA3_9ACTN|nr:hypothetical protein [Nonomuraea cypriaca]MBF8187514.1 hypothetical protein [Nonomuraea cypriaca]
MTSEAACGARPFAYVLPAILMGLPPMFLSRPIVHAMLDAWQVRAHAVAGESHQALRLLSRADLHWEHRDPDEDPAWIYWMRRPSTTIEVGMALVEIGQPATAVQMLEEGMVERTEDYVRDTALGMAAIADAQLGHKNLDGALDTARRAAELVARIGSNRVVDQLRAFAGSSHLASRRPRSSATTSTA